MGTCIMATEEDSALGTTMVSAEEAHHQRSDLHFNKYDRDKRMFYLRVVDWDVSGTRREFDPFPTERTSPDKRRTRSTPRKRILPSNAAYTRLGPGESLAEVKQEARQRHGGLRGVPVGYVLCRVHLDDKPTYGTDEFGKTLRTIAGVEWFDRPKWPGEVSE